MGYEVLVINPLDGSEIAAIITKNNNTAAHLLLGALGVEYESDDEVGSGDCMPYTDTELSTAEEALMLVGNNPNYSSSEDLTIAQNFLRSARQWLSENPESDSVDIGFF